jgi:hypothetical protein
MLKVEDDDKETCDPMGLFHFMFLPRFSVTNRRFQDTHVLFTISLITLRPVTPAQDECECEYKCKTLVASRFAVKATTSQLSCLRSRQDLRQVLPKDEISLTQKDGTHVFQCF